MSNVAPGVYSKIFDLSEYVQAVPSTIGFMAGLCEKGRDNQLIFVGSRSELIGEWGEPNIAKFGKKYGQGIYCGYNFLGEAGSLYWIRPMPDDATYSNIRVSASQAALDTTCSVVIDYIDSANTITEIQTNLTTVSTNYPLCILRPIGRGEYYNGLSVRFTEHSNPLLNGVYIMDIYERQSDGNEVIAESFEVSFDPTAMSLTGDSIWISYVLETYSTFLRAEMIKVDGSYAEGYNYLAKVYDKDIGTISVTLTGGLASIGDTKQVFTDWQTSPESGNAVYMVVAKDGKGNKIYGWLGAATGSNYESCNVFNGRDLSSSTRGWLGSTATFDTSSIHADAILNYAMR